jgi:hypothetical protein
MIEELHAAFRAGEGLAPDAGPVMAAVGRQIRRGRRRRAAVTAVLAAGVAAAVTAAAVSVPAMLSTRDTAVRPGGPAARPGAVPGQSTVDRVRLDGRSVPYAVGWLPAGAVETGRWASGSRAIRDYGVAVATVLLASRPQMPADAERPQIDGQPGYGWPLAEGAYRLRWQWRDGLWAGVTVRGQQRPRDTAVRIARSFRPASAASVRLPFTVGAPVTEVALSGSRATSRVDWTARAWQSSTVVTVSRPAGGAACAECTLTVNGDPARYAPAAASEANLAQLEVHRRDGYLVTVDELDRGRGPGKAAMIRLAASVRITGEPDVSWIGTRPR